MRREPSQVDWETTLQDPQFPSLNCVPTSSADRQCGYAPLEDVVMTRTWWSGNVSTAASKAGMRSLVKRKCPTTFVPQRTSKPSLVSQLMGGTAKVRLLEMLESYTLVSTYALLKSMCNSCS